MEPDSKAPDFQEVVKLIKKRVEEKRATGEYPAELEEKLNKHFADIAEMWDFRDPVRAERAREEFEKHRRFAGTIPPLPLPQRVSRKAVSLATGGQTEDLLERLQSFSDSLAHALDVLFAEVSRSEAASQALLASQIDDLFELTAENHKLLNAFGERLTQIENRITDIEKNAN